ncbi:MAG: hypothetical protein F6K40_26485 [Okeania sp. SIO3I5]|uniref:ATPase, T2SS/T4P/T4SS family n=1 Tax=Okeania sp. SIO3I5 TaxID=2607805 RepID=UPI0013BB56ED|nr:hypothetical protein [Okeania sp. SIO3I5]NEQ39609.1 hypothetical protein [Okeania sp. SIO3I5]
MLAFDNNQGVKQMDNPQIFALIDNILPFEACLYYQILPLSVEGSRVRLGVVDPKDSSALDYARRLLSYLNCSLVTEQISSEIQRSILSSYLSHIGHQKEKNSSASTVTLPEDNQKQIDNSQYGKVGKNHQFSEAKNRIESGSSIKNSQDSKQTKLQLEIQPSSKNSLCDILELSLPSSVEATSLETMSALEPQKLLKQLLVKVLESGIGRLYFEQKQSQGRILWSQDGVLKSVVEDLEPKKIEAIINELKVLTKMSLIPLKKPRQVEIERTYQNNHLLLRLRVMPGNYGEEATLQVLRGAALRFYQQQQLSLLSQDAFKLGKQLQMKINQVCSRQHLAHFQLDSLLTLQKLLDNIEHQIDCIVSQQNNQFL